MCVMCVTKGKWMEADIRLDVIVYYAAAGRVSQRVDRHDHRLSWLTSRLGTTESTLPITRPPMWFGHRPRASRSPSHLGRSTTMSTMESEYVVASKCVFSIRFLHKFLRFVELNRGGPIKVNENNAACIAISTKPIHRAIGSNTLVWNTITFAKQHRMVRSSLLKFGRNTTQPICSQRRCHAPHSFGSEKCWWDASHSTQWLLTTWKSLSLMLKLQQL